MYIFSHLFIEGNEVAGLFEKVSNFAQGILGTSKEQKSREGLYFDENFQFRRTTCVVWFYLLLHLILSNSIKIYNFAVSCK